MTTPQNILPRRIIGPDNIKALRDLSRNITGNAFTFDTCRVQRSRHGGPAIEFDVDTLEVVGEFHPESYGIFLRNRIIPKAERIAEDLAIMPAADQTHELSRLLRTARREDSEIWWVLSANALRPLLFPAAYSEGKRIDNMIYLDRPNDYHRGMAVALGNLSPSAVAGFASFAMRMIDQPVDPALITPTH